VQRELQAKLRLWICPCSRAWAWECASAYIFVWVGACVVHVLVLQVGVRV